MFITEIFKSIQGEGTRAGLPCIFVRLTGCNLRCTWCDTAYAFHGGQKMSVEDVLEHVEALNRRPDGVPTDVPLVELTGGEPLLQQEVYPLAEHLLAAGFTVMVETSGERFIGNLPKDAIRIVDVKCPDSSESDTFDMRNLDELNNKDEVKFVISSRGDYEFARDFTRQIRSRAPRPRCLVLSSPRRSPRQLEGTRHGPEDLALLHASYGQRTEKRERQAFEAIADFYAVQQRLLVKLDHFRAIGGSALTDTSINVPENDLEAGPGHGSAIPVTYVPFRNAHFLSVAVSWAEAIGAQAIYIGAVAEDSSGYPDCRPEYYRVFQELIRVGTRPKTKIDIVTPVVAMKKNEIIRRGMELGAPLHLTWSCYQGEDLACGKCDSCLLRLRAFAEAGIPDPIPYRERAAVRA